MTNRTTMEGAVPTAADRSRWDEIQRLFELCRERHRDEWHGVLRDRCAGREGLAFEVLTLLVAAEGLPPLEGEARAAGSGVVSH
jgi:hypothetical protein